jgi:hypothetical protein
MIHDAKIVNAFIVKLQKYYGVYENKTVLNEIANFIKRTYYQEELEKLYDAIKCHFSNTFNKQPDIAIILEADKSFNVRTFINGIRQIPNVEQKRLEDCTEDFPEGWIDIMKKLVMQNNEKMKDIRKDQNDRI